MFGGALHLFHGGFGFRALPMQGFAQLFRRVRQPIHQPAGIVAQRVYEIAAASRETDQQKSRAQSPRNPPFMHAFHERRKRIAEHDADHQRYEDIARPMQREQDREHGQHGERRAAHIDRRTQNRRILFRLRRYVIVSGIAREGHRLLS